MVAAGKIMHHLFLSHTYTHTHTHTHRERERSEIAHNYSYFEQSSAQNENTASPYISTQELFVVLMCIWKLNIIG